MIYSNSYYGWTTPAIGNITVSALGGGGGGGPAGAGYGITTGNYSWSSYSIGSTTSTNGISIEGNLSLNARSYLKVGSDQINFKLLLDNLKEINHRLRIIIEDQAMLAQYPSLKDAWENYNNAKEIYPRYNSKEFIEAYEHYMLLEAMLKGTE